MDLFSKMNEKDGPVQQNERKRWTCSAKMKKMMDLFSKNEEKDGPVQQNEQNRWTCSAKINQKNKNKQRL